MLKHARTVASVAGLDGFLVDAHGLADVAGALMERTGRSRTSVARWLRWLRARGLLGVVESGTTPRCAPMALATDTLNRAALYVLCEPAGYVDERDQRLQEREMCAGDMAVAITSVARK
jgi:hypothetical protein